MKFKRAMTIFPPRFRTQEDGELYLQCVLNKQKFPVEKWIHPLRVMDGKAVTTQEYKEAPFEVAYIWENT